MSNRFVNMIKKNRTIRKIFEQLQFGHLYKKYFQDYNILLDNQKAIYFWIPKVACTSLKKVMAELLNIDASKWVHHTTFPSVKKKNIDQYEKYYKFGFVRNPYNRLTSCYRNKILSRNRDDQNYINGVSIVLYQYNSFFWEKKFWPEMSFQDFVKSVLQINDRRANPHFRSQHTFLTDSDGEIILDYVGKMENLSKEFDKVMEKIWTEGMSLPHKNKTTKKKTWQDYYTKDLAKKVYQRYKRDFELWYPNVYDELIDYIEKAS